MKKLLNIAIVTAMIFAWVSVFVIPTNAQGIQTHDQSNSFQRIRHDQARYPNKPNITATSPEDGLVIKKTVSCDYQAPILKPWYDCNNKYKGNLKLDGWKTEMCVQNVEVFISENQLRDNGYVPIAKNPGSVGLVDPTNGSSPLVGNSWKDYLEPEWFFLYIFLILAAAILWKLLRGDFNSKAPTPTLPTPPTMNEKAEAVQKILSSMKANDMEGEFELGEGVKGKFTSKKGAKSEKPGVNNQKTIDGQDKKS
jgi:hypothetical protein